MSALNQKLPNSETSTRESHNQAKPVDDKIPRKLSESNSTNGEQYSVSVKKLKQNFQHEVKVTTNILQSLKQETNESFSETHRKDNSILLSATNNKSDTSISSLEATLEKNQESVSVKKLRSLFEEKDKENKTGLELIIRPKEFQYQVHIPYRIETLGGFRLTRFNSTSYMNQVGVLNRADITRSKSIQQDLESIHYVPFKNVVKERQESIDDTDFSSEISDSESVQSVKEARLEESLTEGKHKILL